nr:Retrovirus-related Pol polyprotein from transposon TNT 1-94 [Ipomoea batatas]
MKQFHEIVRILGQIRQHGMNMDDSIAIASIIDKLPPSWKKSDDSWWVDTGATRHVCKDINLYKIYNGLEDGPSLYMGNDYMVKVKGIGQVELLLTSGKKLTLTDVYHAPDVRKILVFGIVLNKCGFKLVFEADRFILSKAGMFVGQGYLCCNMFKLNTSKVDGSVYTVCSSSLWHSRLCHVNYFRLFDMAKDGLIPSCDLNKEP